MTQHKVLILTAGFGEGHNSAARAIKAALAEHPGVSAQLVDLFALRAPRLNQLSRSLYLGMINRAPRAWSVVYRWLDRSTHVPRALQSLRGHRRLLQQLIHEHRPAALCSTYPVYPWLWPQGHGPTNRRCPRFTVVTDALTINSLWYRAVSDLWFVTDEGSAAVLRGAGISADRIQVSGFPVSLSFADRPASLAPLTPTAVAPARILYMINSGRTRALETAAAILAQPGWHVTFTTGRDQQLREEIATLARNAPASSEVLGWTDRIPELLMSHHLVVSKAGGATTQEAINAHCPFIVNQVVPGQERGNYELIRSMDAGEYAGSPDEVVSAIKSALAHDAAKWHRWRRNLQQQARPDAARMIARQIVSSFAQDPAPPPSAGQLSAISR